jgi:hypothetical protein
VRSSGQGDGFGAEGLQLILESPTLATHPAHTDARAHAAAAAQAKARKSNAPAVVTAALKRSVCAREFDAMWAKVRARRSSCVRARLRACAPRAVRGRP